jgi:hypothetical protein
LTEPEAGDWPAVREAVRARLGELTMSTAELARLTCLSETTIRYLGTAPRNKSSLVAMSAVLRWRYDHLTNILNGHPEKNVHIRPPPLATLERIVHEELGSLRQQVRSLAEALTATIGTLGQLQQARQQQQGPEAGR